VFRPGRLQANATFGKTMEQLRNRQNIHLRSEITPSAKFLALGITPLDSDHAECDQKNVYVIVIKKMFKLNFKIKIIIKSL